MVVRHNIMSIIPAGTLKLNGMVENKIIVIKFHVVSFIFKLYKESLI